MSISFIFFFSIWCNDIWSVYILIVATVSVCVCVCVSEILTNCPGVGDRESLSAAVPGTSRKGHFICRYCKTQQQHTDETPTPHFNSHLSIKSQWKSSCRNFTSVGGKVNQHVLSDLFTIAPLKTEECVCLDRPCWWLTVDEWVKQTSNCKET